jgi:hypothetical protein
LSSSFSDIVGGIVSSRERDFSLISRFRRPKPALELGNADFPLNSIILGHFRSLLSIG